MIGSEGNQYSEGARKSVSAPLLARLALIPLAILTISSPGCKKEVSEANEEPDPTAAMLVELNELKDQLTAKEISLRNWEADLRAKEDRLDLQQSTLVGQLEVLDQQLSEARELEAARKRGTAPSIYGKRAIVIDAKSGKVLFEKNADETCAVASTQKLMTGLLVAERGDLETLVKVDTADTLVEPTKLYIKAGEQISRKTLLTGLLVRSGNDLAMCLARDHSGSVEAFAKKMNEKAAALGMEKSKFFNPHGLTVSGQQSTARDMAKLAKAVYKNPVIRETIKKKTYTFVHEDGTEKPLTNTNRVLRSYEPCNGMKTGYTRASGYCLICSGESGPHARIVVVLGSTGTYVWKDAQALLSWSLKG